MYNVKSHWGGKNYFKILSNLTCMPWPTSKLLWQESFEERGLWSAPTLVSSSFLDLSGYFYILWCWNMEERLGGKGPILSWEFLLLSPHICLTLAGILSSALQVFDCWFSYSWRCFGSILAAHFLCTRGPLTAPSHWQPPVYSLYLCLFLSFLYIFTSLL